MLKCLGLIFILLCLGCQAPETPLPEQGQSNTNLVCDEENNLDLFNTRIKPLVLADKPASCQRCHLPGTDISKFIRGQTACQMMSCLIDQKLVDLESPEKSKMLGWITRGQLDDGNQALTDRLVKREHEAFFQWIEYSASCHSYACEPMDDPCGLKPPAQDMSDLPDMTFDMPDCGLAGCTAPDLNAENYGCDEVELSRAFFDHPFEWKGRCSHCHAMSANIQGIGPTFMSSSNDFGGARQTVRYILDDKARFIDSENASMSPLLLKPLNPNVGGVLHGGGTKIQNRDDVLYKDLLAWIEHVNQCQSP